MQMTNPLFKPFACKSLSLPNRIVMAPMTRAFCANGIPPPASADYYARRAAGGVGLIISEGIGIGRIASRNDDRTPVLDALAAEHWRRIVAAVHACGSAMAAQLWHVGGLHDRAGAIAPALPLESPSGRSSGGITDGHAMSDVEVAETIEAYAQAALIAKEAGFDAVELHAAHGYLIDQFFWSTTNLRSDRYGGRSIRERSQFAADVIQAVRLAVGNDYPIIIRISQWKLQDFEARLAENPSQLQDWLTPMVAAGVDMFHCSQRRYWEAEFDGSDLNLAGWVKKLTNLPTVTVGSVGLDSDLITSLRERDGASAAPIDELLRRLSRGDFDLVAIGRALLSDPEWPRKIVAGIRPRPFSRESLARLD
jgi:2,4-dienoyl-CoA reductase-like NADH-dependent reductase (Old Yellow Enzyme family)